MLLTAIWPRHGPKRKRPDRTAATMPEGLATEDGTAIDLDAAEQEFARAMAAPEPDEPVHAAPPKPQDPSEEELGGQSGRPRPGREPDVPEQRRGPPRRRDAHHGRRVLGPAGHDGGCPVRRPERAVVADESG